MRPIIVILKPCSHYCRGITELSEHDVLQFIEDEAEDGGSGGSAPVHKGGGGDVQGGSGGRGDGGTAPIVHGGGGHGGDGGAAPVVHGGGGH